jgi:hypothetical protein
VKLPSVHGFGVAAVEDAGTFEALARSLSWAASARVEDTHVYTVSA